MHLQHANAAILELLDSLSQPGDAAAITSATNRRDPDSIAAMQPRTGRLAAVSQRTEALCSRLTQRRDGSEAGFAAGRENHYSPVRVRASAGATDCFETALACKRAPPGSSDSGIAAVRWPAERVAVAEGSDGEASSSAGGSSAAERNAEMLRVQRLVDDICADLERGSPEREAKPVGADPSEARPASQLVQQAVW